MANRSPRQVARLIVDSLVSDLGGRRGGDFFDTIDEDIKKEILTKWIDITEKEIKEGTNDWPRGIA